MPTGVTAGVARRFGLNVLVARVATVVGVVVLEPLHYPPLGALMPNDAPAAQPATNDAERRGSRNGIRSARGAPGR